MNGQVFFRGIPEDYDEWAELGSPEWAFVNILPYFRKSETDLTFGADDFHGGEGPIPVRRYSKDESSADTAPVLGDVRVGRIPGDAGPQSPGVGGGGAASAEQRGRRADEHQPDVPVHVEAQAEPDYPVGGSGASHHIRGQPRRGHRGGERRRHVRGVWRRDNSERRRDKFAAPADAVRRGAEGAS